MTDSTQPNQGVQDRAVLRQLETIGKDAREARDGMLRLTAVIGEQRYGERIEALHGEYARYMEKIDIRFAMTESALRQDFVHSIKVQDEKREAVVRDFHAGADVASSARGMLDQRVKSLEDDRKMSQGRSGVFRWAADHGGWLFSLGGVLAWLFGITPKPPHGG